MASGKVKELTLAIIKPEIVRFRIKRDLIFQRIEEEGFEIVQQRSFLFSEAQAKKFYSNNRGKFYFTRSVKYISSYPVIACILGKRNAIEDFRTLVVGKEGDRENSLRAIFGANDTMNAVHGSENAGDAKREIRLIFPSFDTKPWDSEGQT